MDASRLDNGANLLETINQNQVLSSLPWGKFLLLQSQSQSSKYISFTQLTCLLEDMRSS
jgi:hypothetical protein